MKLAMIVPELQDGTSYYRAAMPLAMLSRQHPELKLVFGLGDGTQWSWDRLALCDAVFCQRPWGPPHLAVMKMARRLRIPTWVDYDDHTAATPISHPLNKLFANPMVASTVGECVRLATVLTVTTPALASALGREAQVIPNALNDYHQTTSDAPRRKVISWRGSSIHQEDLLTVLGEINQMAAANPSWRWRFIGDPPWDVRHAIPATQLTVGPAFSQQDPLDWMEAFCEAAPFIHIVPLANNRFNMAKSNCSWLEATAAGALVVAPEFPEFVRPGIRNYTTGHTFRLAVESAMQEWTGQMHPNVALSRRAIRAQGLTLSETNKARWKIIRNLCRAPSPIL